VLALSIASGALVWTMQTGGAILAPLGFVLAVWVIGGAIAELWTRSGRGGLGSRLRRLRNLPGADWGKAIAHSGMGITALGIAALVAWEVEDIRVAQIGERYEVSGYEIRLDDVRRVEGPNYLSTMADITVFRNGREVALLQPEKRVYPVAGMPTTEAGIDNGVFRDVYLVIGDPQENGGWAVRTYIKPFANWIWAGCIIMSIGGIFSLSDRRYRVAAGARKAARPDAGAAGVPAE
jgi:cytochrome c-type biogenesis protein CcmF